MVKRIREHETLLLLSMIVLAILLQFQFLRTFNINWDEFFFLSMVHDYLIGNLSIRLQSLHVHAFTWLAHVSINEVDQIVAARFVMLILHSLTAFLLYRIAARATDQSSALFATLAYLSMSHVFRDGSSFRADPIAIFFILAAFDLVVLRKTSALRTAIAGTFFGIAGMVTIKTAIFFPSFLFILALPPFLKKYKREAARRLALGLGTAVGTFAFLYWLHDLSLVVGPATRVTTTASSAFSKMLLDAGLFPQFYVLLFSLLNDLEVWAFLAAGGIVIILGLASKQHANWFIQLEIAALAAPLGSLLFYRNSFPYFYGFLMAPVSVLVAVAWQALNTYRVEGRTGPVGPMIKFLAIVTLLLNLINQSTPNPENRLLENQRHVLGAVHRIFPESVPYFDSTSIMASYPQAGFFMSTWGMDSYRATGKRVFATGIAEQAPPLLIADHPVLDLEHKVYKSDMHYGQQLFAEDRTALETAYIHHWGPIYVPGTRVTLDDPAQTATANIAIRGQYTLEAEHPVMIDGRLVKPRESLALARGPHRVTSSDAPLLATLRFGEDLYRPSDPAPPMPLFLGF